MNLLQAVQQASARLEQAGVSFGHGTTNAWDEAAWLVLWRLGLPLDTALDERPLSPEQQQAIDALLTERIASRRPAAYLTGEAWLQGLPFFVDERTIVPRSLVAEVLAEGLLDPWLPHDAPALLDLCTGNGSLAVLAALAWPEATVDAADLSADALAVAARNLQRHGVQDRVRLHQGDSLAAVPGTHYDMVLCNPPYVNSASMAALPPEFRAEPALALAGGENGMDFIGPLLKQLPAHLNEHGVLVLEIGHEREHFEAAFPTLQPLWLPTSAGDDQVLLLTRAALA